MALPPNIILIGFMGSGKTTTGKELSKMLDFHFFDMDHWIEKKNKLKIKYIFKNKGEAYFRRQEKKALQWLGSKNNYVISTGGGAWLDKESRKKLLKLGLCVWLKISASWVWRRVGSNLDQRPMLSKTKKPIQEVKKLLKKRERYYNLAHVSINTNGKSPKLVAQELAKQLKIISRRG